MRKLKEDASRIEMLEAINDLIASNDAICTTLMNLSEKLESSQFESKINDLKKKLLAYGDTVVSLVEEFRNFKNKFDKTQQE